MAKSLRPPLSRPTSTSAQPKRSLLAAQAEALDNVEYSDDEPEVSESESESSDSDTEKPVSEARRDAIYNSAGLHEKLEDIGWPDGIDWTHSLSLTYKHEGSPVDVNDDLTREMSFYTQGLEGAREAYTKLQTLNIPFLRPTDYYAEMIKSDTHMLKIKDKLLFQKKQMEESEERRKQREAKKYGKEVQAERLKERTQQKKKDIESVKKWRKGRSDSGFADGEEPFEVDGEEKRIAKKQKVVNASPWDRSGGKGGRGGGRGRESRDAKFGYGGRKGSVKRNTADSTADESGFRANFKGKDTRGRGGGRSGGRGGGRSSGGGGRSSSRGGGRGRGRGRGRS